jgi:hypothetical protein
LPYKKQIKTYNVLIKNRRLIIKRSPNHPSGIFLKEYLVLVCQIITIIGWNGKENNDNSSSNNTNRQQREYNWRHDEDRYIDRRNSNSNREFQSNSTIKPH